MEIAEFQRAVLTWYKDNGRDLPWRQTTDPYKILVSEIMLQQTQADRVIPKYLAWLDQFPDWQSLAAAEPAAVIRAWAGLGYNRRALYLQRTAEIVSQLSSDSVVQLSEGEWRKLPGVGPYTAAAILSFAFNRDVALVDTNIKRIYQLLIFGDQEEPSGKEVYAVAEQYVPSGQSRDWHNALMDLGTAIAREKSAGTQQRLLVELLPVLRGFDLPEASDRPLSRPKQSPFKNSRRYWRGKIVGLLRKEEGIKPKVLWEKLDQGVDRAKLESILGDLEREGMIEVGKGLVGLPSKVETKKKGGRSS